MDAAPKASARAELVALGRGAMLLVRSAPLAVALQYGSQVVRGLVPVATAAAIGTVASSVTSRDERELRRAVLILVAALAVTEVVDAYRRILDTWVNERFRLLLRSRVMAAVDAIPGLAPFEDRPTADKLALAARVGTGPGQFATSLGTLISTVVRGVGFVALTVRVAWWLPLPAMLAALPKGVNTWRHGGVQTQAFRSGAEEMRHAEYGRALGVGLPDAKEVRLFGINGWLLDRYRQFWSRGMALAFADVRRELRDSALLGSLKLLAWGIPFAYVFMRFSNGQIGVGVFTTTVVALSGVAGVMQYFEGYLGNVRNYARFVPEHFEVVDLPKTPTVAASGTRTPPTAPEQGVRFDGVSFAYPGTDGTILSGLDLVLPAGESVAIVGANGAGKSTIVKLLCRFYDPSEGRITLDGVDIRDIDLRQLRRRFGVVFQDFVHYPLTAADNVGFGCVERRGDRGLLDAAASRAGATEVVDRLEHRWDTVLSRQFGGTDLSGGEWQRIALARALSAQLGADASLLVLDEPTASLDVRVEHDLYARFTDLTRGRTTLLISHRLSTVRMASQIAVLENGRVTESGAHDDLIAAGGTYAELFALQAQRFRQTGRIE